MPTSLLLMSPPDACPDGASFCARELSALGARFPLALDAAAPVLLWADRLTPWQSLPAAALDAARVFLRPRNPVFGLWADATLTEAAPGGWSGLAARLFALTPKGDSGEFAPCLLRLPETLSIAQHADLCGFRSRWPGPVWAQGPHPRVLRSLRLTALEPGAFVTGPAALNARAPGAPDALFLAPLL